YHYTKSEEGSITRMIITSKRLMDLSDSFGRGAVNKRIPGYIMDLPKDTLEEFLEGYMSGDGNKQGILFRANSVSRELIYQLGQVVQKLYSTPYRIHFTERPDTHIIEGRVVNQRDT